MGGYSSKDLRNVVFLGHGNSGKTSLCEAILFRAGATKRQGSVDDGSSILDFDPEEKERKYSIYASIASCEWEGARINLIDAPGYLDYTGATLSAMEAADAAIVVVSAPDGIELNTAKLWQAAKERGLPRCVVISKPDFENADPMAAIETVKEAFGQECAAVNLAVGKGSSFGGTYDLWDSKAEAAEELGPVAESAREQLMESVLVVDDELVERYLEGEEIEQAKINDALAEAILQGKVVPVVCCSSKTGAGVEELMSLIAHSFPSAETPPEKKWLEGEEEKSGSPYEEGTFSGLVFKTVTDPFVGKVSFVRVLSGEVRGDSSIYNSRTKKTEKVPVLLRPFGKELDQTEKGVAGDIVAIPKLEEVNVFDTLCDQSKKMGYVVPRLPVPMVSLAVSPKSRSDEAKLSSSLGKLAEEDPTFLVFKDKQTLEMVISGMSSLHLDVMLSQLKRRFDVEAVTSTRRIPYKETATAKAEGKYRHKKQTGGRGQYGEVCLRLEPKERGSGHEFESKIFGGSIPSQYVPAVEKGVREAVEKGVLAGYPVEDVKVTVYDGSYHSVDSSEAAFKIAASKAFAATFMQAKPVLLEPVAKVEISVPSRFLGDITGDLNARRGRILGVETSGNYQTISALIPEAEIANYATELRSITGGQGFYTMEFSHYDIVPQRTAEAVIVRVKAAKEKE
jgi:elongation factor G